MRSFFQAPLWRDSYYAGGAVRRFARGCLQPSYETLEVVRRHRLLCEEQKRSGRQQSYRLEIIQQVVSERVRCTIHDVGVVLAQAEHVTARERDGWGRLSDDGPGHYNPDPSEGPWGGGVMTPRRCTIESYPTGA
jgi:hypothetical protein